MHVKEIQECTLSVKYEYELIKEFKKDKDWTLMSESTCMCKFQKILKDCIIKVKKGEENG